MTAILFFGLPDIWSDLDAALNRGIRKLSVLDQSSINQIIELMTPYKSYLSLHIWKAIDTGLL